MSQNLNIMKKSIIYALLTSILCTGCLTSQKPVQVSKHAGVTHVPKPSMKETNEEVWRVYYEDQFDAFEGNVAMPTSEFPESAKLGYYNAKKHWDKLVRNAEINRQIGTRVLIGAIGVLVLYISLGTL